MTLENHCIPGSDAEAKEPGEKVAEHEKVDAATKGAANGCGRKRATVADRQVVALEVVLAQEKALHLRLVDVAARSEVIAKDGKEKLQGSKAVLRNVGKGTQLRTDKLENLRKQSAGLTKAAEYATNQLAKVARWEQRLKEEVSFLKLGISEDVQFGMVRLMKRRNKVDKCGHSMYVTAY